LFSVFAYHAGERVLKRREWRGWELVALATVVTAAATALTKEWPTAVVVSAVAAAGSAAVAVLISRAKANWDRRAQESSQLESHLLVSESGLPPRVS